MPAVEAHEGWGEEADAGEDVGDEGEFEDESGGEQGAEKEAGVVLNGYVVLDEWGAEGGKEAEGYGKKDEVTEGDAAEEAEGDEEYGEAGDAAFVVVKAGGDELPEFVDEEGKGNGEACEEEDLEVEGELPVGNEVLEVDAGSAGAEWTDEDVVDEEVCFDGGGYGGNEEDDAGADEPGADFVEVVEDGAGGAHGLLGGGAADAVAFGFLWRLWRGCCGELRVLRVFGHGGAVGLLGLLFCGVT